MSEIDKLNKTELIELAYNMECTNENGKAYEKSDLQKFTIEKLKNIIIHANEREDEFMVDFEKAESNNPPESMQDLLPKYGSLEWQEFVLSQFRQDELFDGAPKSSALRRVAQELLGDVVTSKAEFISVIPQNESRAVTVSYTVSINWKLNFNIMNIDFSKSDFYDIRTFGGMADCIENCDDVFARHPAATAETKAMGRAYKNALNLNIVTMEEKLSGYDTEPVNSKITEQVQKMIKTKCKALNILLPEVMKKAGYDKELKNLTDKEGKDLFNFINKEYQQK